MVLIINFFHIRIILWGLHPDPVVLAVVVEVIVVVVAEFIDVEIVEVAVVFVVIIAAMVVSYTGVFSLLVVSLVELQACIILVTVETIRNKILTIVFPLLDIIILPDALVTNTLHKSIINIFYEHNWHFYMQSKVKAFTSHWINYAST